MAGANSNRYFVSYSPSEKGRYTYINVFSDSVQVTETRSRDGHRGVFTVTVDNLLFVALIAACSRQGSGFSIFGAKDCLVLEEFLLVSGRTRGKDDDVREACKRQQREMRPWRGRASRSNLVVNCALHS